MQPYRVCVFCGSSPGTNGAYVAAAAELGRTLAARGVPIVYGAGGHGIMGALSAAALDAGGEVIGVIPSSLMERELGRRDLTDLRVVGTMHERKALMQELSSAFVVLPGGLGTYEELFEILTWAQLGLHAKPIVVADVDGYFAPLRDLLDHAVAEGFVRAEERKRIVVCDGVAAALETLGAPVA